MEGENLTECLYCHSRKTWNLTLKYLLSFFIVDLQFPKLFINLIKLLFNLNCHLFQLLHLGLALSWSDNQFFVHLGEHGVQLVERQGLYDDRVRRLHLFLRAYFEMLGNGNLWNKTGRPHASHLKPKIGVSVLLLEVSEGTLVVTDDSLTVSLVDQVLCYWLKVLALLKYRNVVVIMIVGFLNLFK